MKYKMYSLKHNHRFLYLYCKLSKLIIFDIGFKKGHVTAFINYEYYWAGETGRNSQNPYPYSGFYTGTKVK